MPITNGYCNLESLKAADRLNILDTASDALLSDVIEAVSRWIDEKTGRIFYSVASSARYYTAVDYSVVFADDFQSVSAVATDDNNDGVYEVVWTTGDYEAIPYNLRSGWPYEGIETKSYGDYNFSRNKKGVKITAVWGWAAVPSNIEQACLLQAERLWKRFATPLGSSAMSALGEMRLQIPKADPDVEMLLAPFVRLLV